MAKIGPTERYPTAQKEVNDGSLKLGVESLPQVLFQHNRAFDFFENNILVDKSRVRESNNKGIIQRYRAYPFAL